MKVTEQFKITKNLSNKMKEFLLELINNVKNTKSYETFEVIPNEKINKVLGKETLLEDYDFFEESKDKNLINQAEEYKKIFQKVYNSLEKELDQKIYFETQAVKTTNNKEGILFTIDLDKSKGIYRYFVDAKDLTLNNENYLTLKNSSLYDKFIKEIDKTAPQNSEKYQEWLETDPYSDKKFEEWLKENYTKKEIEKIISKNLNKNDIENNNVKLKR